MTSSDQGLVAVPVGSVVPGSVVVGVDSVVGGVVSVVVGVVGVVQAEVSGAQGTSAAEPPADAASAASRTTIRKAGRGALGTACNINDSVRGCVAPS